MLTRKFIPYGATFVALAAAMVVAIALTLTLVGGGSAAAATENVHHMTVKVENAHITLNVLPEPSATYFIVIGDITEFNGKPATGKYYCKGLITDPAFFGLPPLVGGPAPDGISFVDQRFRIDGVGTLIGAGAEASDQPLAVTGATGRFTGAHGSYTATGLPIEAGGTGVLDFEFRILMGG